MKQTAVQWFIDNLEKYEDYAKISYRCLGEIEIALEMEKQQHGKTWDAALDKYEVRAGNYMRAYEDFDDYFAETYGNKGSDATSSQTEISDEEIEYGFEYFQINRLGESQSWESIWKEAIKWYREQLKKKQ